MTVLNETFSVIFKHRGSRISSDYNIMVNNKIKDKTVLMYPTHTRAKVQFLSKNWAYDETMPYMNFRAKNEALRKWNTVDWLQYFVRINAHFFIIFWLTHNSYFVKYEIKLFSCTLHPICQRFVNLQHPYQRSLTFTLMQYNRTRWWKSKVKLSN